MKLNRNTLSQIGKNKLVKLPQIFPINSGIAHFGLGAFHRAHQALYTQQLIEKTKDKNWGITGVGIMQYDNKMNQVLKQQDFLYTLAQKSKNKKVQYQIISSICNHVCTKDGWEKIVEVVSDQNIKIITLTITQGGYNINKDTGDFDFENQIIKDEIKNWKIKPITIFGYLTHIIEKRVKEQKKGFTILSCDNVQHNGKILQKSLISFIKTVNPQLIKWIQKYCTFPCSMVDRITPQVQQKDIQQIKQNLNFHDKWPVVCEDFKQWVIEDKFIQGRPQWQLVGVQFVQNVSSYQKMKLRILNASHQALCYLGYLKKYRYVDEAANDKQISQFVKKYLKQQVIQTLDPVPGINLDDYQIQTLQRFGNSNIKDTLSRICEYTSDRIPLFNLPAMIQNSKKQKSIPLSSLIIASWISYTNIKDQNGKLIQIVDKRKDQIQQAIKKVNQNNDDIKTFLQIPDLFNGLEKSQQFIKNVQLFYNKLKSNGVSKTLQQVI